MRKVLIIFAAGVSSSLTASGQQMDIRENEDMLMDILAAAAAIFLVYLVGLFVLSLVRRILDYKLRNKFIELRGDERMLNVLSEPSAKNDKKAAMKAFIVLAGVGLGLFLVNFFAPFGVHSLMIMAFCISLSFLGYYYFLDKTMR